MGSSYIFGLWFIILALFSIRAGDPIAAMFLAAIAVVALGSNLRKLL